MLLSVVIPARNEAGILRNTVEALIERLRLEGIPFEIVGINDSSTDQTETVLKCLSKVFPEFLYVNNPEPHGFGRAVRRGLEVFKGEAIAVFMADGSDSPEDLVRFYREMLSSGTECVFGSRFIHGSLVTGYPIPKLILNRLANLFIQMVFGISYNDTTNAFKMYRRQVIEGLAPLLSHHFNLTVELPLKAIVRGYSYKVIPNSWNQRKSGLSKLKIKEMGSRYLFIVLYCLIEKWLSRGDYHRFNPNDGMDDTSAGMR